jgi:lipoprotein-anchoring transpeptidase ErfK/SrfK
MLVPAVGRPTRVVLALLLVGLVSACSLLPARVGGPRAVVPSPLPTSIVGDISFSPPTGASDIDPSALVVVKSANSDGVLKTVTVTQDGGPSLDGQIDHGVFTMGKGLVPDATYTITATITVKTQQPGLSQLDQQQTSNFATVTTPKVVSLQPAIIGPDQSTVLALSQPARDINVIGAIKAELGPDGTTVTAVPQTYEQGRTYDFSLVTRSLKGFSSAPQGVSFKTLGAATSYAYPDNGSSNLGVAIPLTLTLSAPPADRADFSAHLTVTVQPPAASPSPSPSPQGGVCAPYASPTPGGTVEVTPNWLSSKKVRLMPKTPDGYWPADSTISLHASVSQLKTTEGNWFGADINTAFNTADKRLVDVDLSSQTLTACRNGAQANQFPISSGTTKHPTYTGSFFIYYRVADEEMKSPEGQFAPDYYDIKHVPWTQYFDGGAALHGAWWHNNFGHPMSHGCVNVQDPTQNTRWPHAAPQAKFLWDFDYIGDPVIVHGVTPGLTAATQPSD